MQTSKSYTTGINNIEIKLELDDLEYVFADGRNLIINHDETADDAENENFVYTDGTQAIMLHSGVRHYIQTVQGETYLVDNDSENVQQLVFNTEDQLEESNGVPEYLESDGNGESVVYKLADAENILFEGQSHPKRFKIGDAEYITLNNSQNLQLSEDNEFRILDDNSVIENGNFQYAILKDGKLHLQLCEAKSIEVENDGGEEVTKNNKQEIDLTEESVQHVFDKDKVQEYVIVNSDLATESTVNAFNLSKISGKNILTGKSISLEQDLNRIEYKANKGSKKNEASNKGRHNQYLNKKLLIRKNSNGRSLFGRILHIEPAKKVQRDEELDNSKQYEIRGGVNNHTIILDVDSELSHINKLQEEDKTHENQMQEPVSDEYRYIINVDNNKLVTDEQINFISKTLNGLVDMPSFRKKLKDHKLEVKYIEKNFNEEAQEVIKDVRFIHGYLSQQNGEFVLDESDEHRNKITLVTVTVLENNNNQKSTKVTFHDRPIVCYPCNRNFKSVALLGKHIETYHMDKTIGCNVCQLQFTNHVLLNEHRKTNGHYFNCGLCNKRFTTQGSLKRHKSMHDQNLKLECVICKTEFPNVTNLSKHLLTCTFVKAYQCDTCGKSFVTYGDLNMHKKVHNPSKMCYCDICGREFSRHSNLLRHIEIHKGDGDLYKCGICECSYKFISSLTRHTVQNHMNKCI